MHYPKRLIEVDLPIKAISTHARREKSTGQLSSLHVWWSRKPLGACRAVLCSTLWFDPADEYCPQAFRDEVTKCLCKFAEKVRTDSAVLSICKDHWSTWQHITSVTLKADLQQCWPDMRYALLKFIADFADSRAATIPIFLEVARDLTTAAQKYLGNTESTSLPLIMDSFAGGGSIPFEALRIGADVFASDLNPVAVLLNKVIVEYMPRYNQSLSEEVRNWGIWIKEHAELELAQFYPKDDNGDIPIAYLWARTIICEGPMCGTEIPLMFSLWLSKKDNNLVALRLCPNVSEKRVDFELLYNPKASDITEGTIKRGSAICPVCGYTTPVTAVRRQLKGRQGGTNDARLFAVVTTKPKRQGRFYRIATQSDLAVIHQVKEALEKRKKTHQGLLSLVPDEPLPLQGTLGFRVQPYGLEKWEDLFTDRQKLLLVTIVDLIHEAGKIIASEHDSSFALAVQTCLALALDRQVDHSNTCCTWNPTGLKIQHLFARQALPMIWGFAEAQPFGNSVGDWLNSIECVLTVLDNASLFPNIGHVEAASAVALPLPDDSVQVFVTDPPYYDAVPYADLSDFFYVWLKRTLGEHYPDLFASKLTPKDSECVVDEIKGHDKVYFERLMGMAMVEGCRVLAPDGICTVVFAHKSTSGWEAQLQAMIDAGWIVTGSWPIDTEMGTRLRAMDSAALASSIHLACRPRKNPDGTLRTNIVGDWRDVLYELPKRIHEWMPRLASEGIVGADAIFSCLGPALEIFSRYSSVERADGEKVPLREYLEYVWAAVSKEALTMIFQGADTSDFEPDARLTAMWLWTLSSDEDRKEPRRNSKNNGKITPSEINESDNDEEAASPKQVVSGHMLEFDAARKIAQGLGVYLDKLTTLVEIKGSTARLRSVIERGRFLFEKDTSELVTTKPRKREMVQQLSMFSIQELETEIKSNGNMPTFSIGKTMLDRLHQSMLLFAAGHSEVLRGFLHEEGIGTDPRFWRLAVAFSSLYPHGSEERRWVDGVQSYKKGLGL